MGTPESAKPTPEELEKEKDNIASHLAAFLMLQNGGLEAKVDYVMNGAEVLAQALTMLMEFDENLYGEILNLKNTFQTVNMTLVLENTKKLWKDHWWKILLVFAGAGTIAGIIGAFIISWLGIFQ